MLIKLKAVWFFLKRWDDVIGIILVILIAVLLTFLMVGKFVNGTNPFITGKTFFYIVGIVVFIIAIANFIIGEN